ncbi:hypothetical protein ACHQM5_006907 [Ranunculus cassubicifolius]
MRTIMAKTPHDSSFSFSRRHFHWRKKVDDEDQLQAEEHQVFHASLSTSSQKSEEDKVELEGKTQGKTTTATSVLHTSSKKKLQAIAVARFRSVLIAFNRRRSHFSSGLGNRVVGTLFGYRRGHVHFAFQDDSKAIPAFMIELATPTSGLVREMASGLVRIALECDKKVEKKGMKLLEEPLWRTYCNGKKCGYAMKRECGPEELRVLKALEPISMGAGVLPGNGIKSEAGELMYMRAKFERVVGSRDSEAFYMMNPDSTGGPELSLYLLRV